MNIIYNVKGKNIIVEVSNEVCEELLTQKKDYEAEKKELARHCNRSYDGYNPVFSNYNKPYRYQGAYDKSVVHDFTDSIMEKRQKTKEDKQNLQRIMNALSELTKKQQRRFLLRYYQGLSVQEIANLEGVHFTTIYNSIRVAKAHIMNKVKTNDR